MAHVSWPSTHDGSPDAIAAAWSPSYNGCSMPSPRGHLTVSLGPQEERDGPEVLLCSERSETPDTMMQCTLGSLRASLACPGVPHGKNVSHFAPPPQAFMGHSGIHALLALHKHPFLY
jgi:hypothetical protein